jgi:hypothetical protein
VYHHRRVEGAVRVAIGPVEYIIIEFPGNNFRGDIVPAMAKLIENEVVRIIDLVFILKGPDGHITIYEHDELDELAPFANLHGEVGALLNQEDVDYAAAALAPNSSAAVIVWEDTWATELALAIRGAGGIVREGARIPPDLIDAAMADLAG